jgi:hypothetical protein
MSDKPTSETHEETNVVEREITGGSHYRTTIRDGEKSVSRTGNTSEDAEKNASEAWDRLNRED